MREMIKIFFSENLDLIEHKFIKLYEWSGEPLVWVLMSAFLLKRNIFNCLLLLYYPLANEVAKGYSNATVRPSFRPSHPCEHSRINILQWILTKLGTYVVLKKIWNPIDFQGHRVKFLLHNILVNTLESTSFNGFWLNLVYT
jgi:hypothetical protein